MTMKRLTKILIAGLVTILPLVATLFIVLWLGRTAETIAGGFLKLVFPAHFYRPGMGVLAGLAMVFLVGILMETWIVQKLFDLGERIFLKIPFVKSVYAAVKDLAQFVSPMKQKGEDDKSVVMVRLGDTPMEIMGFVTRREFGDLQIGNEDKDTVAVYLPMSYQIGGFTVLVPRSSLRPIHMPLEEAMRFALTAGMGEKRAGINKR